MATTVKSHDWRIVKCLQTPFPETPSVAAKSSLSNYGFPASRKSEQMTDRWPQLKKANPQTQFKKSSPNKQQDRGGQTCGLAGSASGRVCGQRLLWTMAAELVNERNNRVRLRAIKPRSDPADLFSARDRRDTRAGSERERKVGS